MPCRAWHLRGGHPAAPRCPGETDTPPMRGRPCHWCRPKRSDMSGVPRPSLVRKDPVREWKSPACAGLALPSSRTPASQISARGEISGRDSDLPITEHHIHVSVGIRASPRTSFVHLHVCRRNSWNGLDACGRFHQPTGEWNASSLSIGLLAADTATEKAAVAACSPHVLIGGKHGPPAGYR